MKQNMFFYPFTLHPSDLVMSVGIEPVCVEYFRISLGRTGQNQMGKMKPLVKILVCT